MGYGVLNVVLLIGVLYSFITLTVGICTGVCVNKDQCDKILGDDLRSDDIFCRDLNDFFLTPDCPFLEVRCDVEHVVTTRVPPPSGSTRGGTSGENNDRSDEHVQGNSVFGECGMRNPDGIAFKVANSKFNETKFGEFPWMVAILQANLAEETEASTYVCGGSLIAPNVILTAAHCVMHEQADQLTVRAGEWDTMTTKEIYPHQDRKVSSKILHPNFIPRLLHHDVALLVLEKPFTAAKNVQLACLPPQGMDFTSANCFATGWGKTASDADSYHEILKRIPLPMVQQAECQNALRTTKLGNRFRLHESFICAGGEEGIDTCTGDGGSPLVCPVEGVPNKYYQAGIVAWGINFGQTDIPGVYVRTSSYSHWINNELSKIDH